MKQDQQHAQVALDELGLPCYHMVECFKHPGHAEQWTRAAGGERCMKPLQVPCHVHSTSKQHEKDCKKTCIAKHNAENAAAWLPSRHSRHTTSFALQLCLAPVCSGVTPQFSLREGLYS